MVAIISAVLYTAAVLIAILLIALVLVQPSKGGGFGSAFGGVGESVFGAQTMGYLSKLTVVLITVFFTITLLLASISGHKAKVVATASSSAALTTSGAAEKKADANVKSANAKVGEKQVKQTEKAPAKTNKSEK